MDSFTFERWSCIFQRLPRLSITVQWRVFFFFFPRPDAHTLTQTTRRGVMVDVRAHLSAERITVSPFFISQFKWIRIIPATPSSLGPGDNHRQQIQLCMYIYIYMYDQIMSVILLFKWQTNEGENEMKLKLNKYGCGLSCVWRFSDSWCVSAGATVCFYLFNELLLTTDTMHKVCLNRKLMAVFCSLWQEMWNHRAFLNVVDIKSGWWATFLL